MQNPFWPLAVAAVISTASWAQVPPDRTPGATASFAEPLGPLELPAVLDLVERGNPHLQVATRELEAQAGAVLQAGLRRNPEVGSSLEDIDRSHRRTTVQLSQPLELGGKREARTDAAERTRAAALADLRQLRTELRAEAIAAFFDLLAAQERRMLAQASADLAREGTAAAARRVAAGKVSPVDETRARIAELGAQVEAKHAASELANARKRLAALWGTVEPRFAQATGDLQSLPAVLDPAVLAQRLARAPALVRARLEVDRRNALAEVERTRQVPDVTVGIGLLRDDALRRNQALLGVSLPLPVFDRNQGNLLEALRRTDKARDEVRVVETRLASELAQSHERLLAARDEVRVLQQEILPGAQGAYDAASQGFALGKFSFLEALDAQRTLFQTRAQLLRAIASAHRAAADIDRVIGIDARVQEEVR